MIANRLSISVLTSCTGLKVQRGTGRLTQQDFASGRDHLAAVHRELAESLVPAENLYRGQQHVRLMLGVEHARHQGHRVPVWIASAGYGLLAGDDLVATYECTFQGMSAGERRAWARRLSLAESVTEVLRRPADAAIVLLGEDYFTACLPTAELPTSVPTMVICGARIAVRLKPASNVYPIVLRETDTRRFGCGLVGLKGEVARRLLTWLVAESRRIEDMDASELLDELAAVPRKLRESARA